MVAGTDFGRIKRLDRWWSVSNWPSAAQEALVGVRAASVVSPKNQPFDLSFQGHAIHAAPAGTVQTGAAEDSRVYLSLPDFVAWTGVQPSTIEVAATGSPEEITGIMRQLAQAVPAAEVRPVRQIMEGEARVLGKTRATLLAATALIILTAALCVLSTLMGFHAPVAPRFSVLPFVLAGSIVVTLLSAILPISLLRRVQPAGILRGE